MRILLVTGVHPTPYRPTKGTFNRELVAALRAAGDDVRVVAPVPWTDLVRSRRQQPAAPGVHHPVWFYPPRIAHARHHRWMRRTVLPAVRRATASWSPDLVLGYWAHPDGTVAVEAARAIGAPVALLVGGSDVLMLTADAARRDVILETLRSADRVLAVGAPLARRIVALGVPEARVGWFVRGVDRARFHPGDRAAARTALGLPLDRTIALWVGRMVPVKGLDVLLDAWDAVARGSHRPLLALVGDGELRDALAKRAASLPPDSVRFVGAVAHDALPDWYRAADVIALPSRSEGIPNVLLEGLACGTPFVASDVGGVSELLEPASVAVPKEDVAALRDALARALAAEPMTRRAEGVVPDRTDAIAALRETLRDLVAPALAGSA